MKGNSNRIHMDGLRHRAGANAGIPLLELPRNRIVACQGEFAVAAMRQSGESQAQLRRRCERDLAAAATKTGSALRPARSASCYLTTSAPTLHTAASLSPVPPLQPT